MGRSPSNDDISGLKKGPWTEEEDDLLTNYIRKHGHGSWRALPKAAGLNRCGKSCRLRWTNYLRPDIKRGQFTKEEEDMIIKLHSVLGNKWSRIATHLPRRTDNEIKNYWNTHLRKKLLQMGLDPVTHKPRDDLNIFANLSQLFPTQQNLGSALMNPWAINNNNTSLQLQPNVAELAKLQVLHNIFQILNTSINTLPSIDDQINPFNLGILPNLHGLGDNTCSSSQLGFCQLSNDVGPSHVSRETYSNIPELHQRFNNNNTNNDNNNYNSKSNLLSNTSYETLDESKLPSLQNLSPDEINQIESNNTKSSNNSSAYTPINDEFFNGFDKLLDAGNSDFWKEFMI